MPFPGNPLGKFATVCSVLSYKVFDEMCIPKTNCNPLFNIGVYEKYGFGDWHPIPRLQFMSSFCINVNSSNVIFRSPQLYTLCISISAI